MSSSQDTACIVCGAKSAFRCPSCYSATAYSVHFCGKEHQQIMWPYHKVVCGSLSHPFALPPFSDAELQFTCANLATTDRDSLTQDYLRALYGALEVPIHHLEQAEVQLRSLVGQQGDFVKRAAGDTNSGRTPGQKILHIRSFNSTRIDESATGRSRQVKFLDAFPNVYAHYSANSRVPVPSDTAWYSEFCHRIAALTAAGVMGTNIILRLALDLRAAQAGGVSPAQHPEVAAMLRLDLTVSEALEAFLLRGSLDPAKKVFCDIARAATLQNRERVTRQLGG